MIEKRPALALAGLAFGCMALSTIGAVAVAAAMFSLAREHARNLFARFVPRDVVDEVLARTDDDLRLGGEELDGTAMFVDLRSFTPFVDAHSADDVIAVLNRYLEIVSRGVHLYGGTVVAEPRPGGPSLGSGEKARSVVLEFGATDGA